MRQSPEVDLILTIDKNQPLTVRRQLADQLRAAISTGALRAGAPLPPTRVLAQHLSITRSTVVLAYEDLQAEGWLVGRQGSGTAVAHLHPLIAPAPAADTPRPSSGAPATDLINMRPADLDPTLVPQAMWRRAWRQTQPSVAPADPAGAGDLRQALAQHLGASRGLATSPEQIVVCSGVTEALILLTQALGWAGRHVLVEEPGHPASRHALQLMGVTTRAVPVFSEGVDPAAVAAERDAAALLLTPSHQFPLGATMPVPERLRLLAWAARTGAVIVEDDYDGEYRFDRGPLPSMASLDVHHTCVYLGSLSKVLDPGLRLTYLRVPPTRLNAVLTTREALGPSVATPVQQAVTHLLAHGHLRRHLARTRRIYQDRRQTVLLGLAKVPQLEVSGTSAGLHLIAHLPPHLPAEHLTRAAREQGVMVATVAEFSTGDQPPNALVIGYSAETPHRLRTGAKILATLTADLARRHTHSQPQNASHGQTRRNRKM